jgi:hypothetical protein
LTFFSVASQVIRFRQSGSDGPRAEAISAAVGCMVRPMKAFGGSMIPLIKITGEL